jgi:predicted nuclease of predicted toxin-antitoxin system
MQFIVDESAGTAVAEYLRGAGHDVLAVAEVMPQADDSDILARAVSEKRILVTNDKDFGELVFRSGQALYGVVLLRLHDESSANRVRVMKMVIEQHTDRLVDHFAVATEDSVRIRPVLRLLVTSADS